MRKLFTLTFVFLISMTWLYGQSKTVTGTVKDSQSMMALPGVSVTISGQSGGTQTDEAGRFSLEATPTDSLVFSFVGFVSKTIIVGDKSQINVFLDDENLALEEVVVVGYGTQKKVDLTGAIGSVKAADIVKQPAMSAMQSIQGKVAGLNVTASEAPGSTPQVTIRGLGTALAGRNPLYIVDGFPMDNLNSINPSDIESIDVLKDASSASIYGVRASNGVIMVTTKKGKMGSIKIGYEGYVGMKNMLNQVKMADASQYIEYYNENIKGIGRGTLLNTSQSNNTNWFDEMLQNGTVYNNAINLSGGSEIVDYFVSVNNFTENGILDGSKFSRNTIRNNNTYKFLNNKLKFNQTLNLSFNKSTPKPYSSFNDAYRQTPLAPVMFDNGRYGTSIYNTTTGVAGYQTQPGESTGNLNSIGNPIYAIKRANQLNNSTRIQGGIEGEYQILDFLKINSRIGGTKIFSNERTFSDIKDAWLNGSPLRTEADFEKLKNDNPNVTQYANNSLSYKKNEDFRWQWETFLTFDKNFNGHQLNAVAGFSREKYNISNMLSGTGYDLLAQEQYWNIDMADPEYTKILNQTFYTPIALASYFGRVQYNYNSKYYATATFRRDGSSIFRSTGDYFENFPSFGIGWTISNEDFMKDNTVLNFLKLRANWGVLGNQDIPLNVSQLLTADGSSNLNYVFGPNQDLVLGAAFGSPAMPLKWEKTYETGVGLDFEMFDRKLSGSFDYYDKLNSNLLMNVIPILNSPFSNNFYDHGGKVRNNGIEVVLNWKNSISEDFNYNIGVNYAYNHNELKEVKPAYDGAYGGSLSNGQITKQIKANQPLYGWWMWETDGVWQNQDQIDNGVKYGSPRPGHLKYKDQNDDGVIDNRDKVFFGSYMPSSTYGVNLGINYKSVDFSLSGYGVAGNKIYNALKGTRINGGENITEETYLNRWTPTNNSNINPGADRDSYASNYYLESGNYFRINNITLGYTFKKLYNSTSNMRLYFTAQNPFMFTKYTGFSPEIPSDGNPQLTSGIELSAYPTTRNFLFGINVQF
ncbi:SusC/RagA family TonB-linked outer membrane protein [Sphingobacterium cellulitidis]|uniref:SusC/RagA family TonB-linked outer membrane protein n=1 Tax=Sphingobacterium cellulitidis TaxID=1768011 RepID=UPI000B9418F3|nr:SusC/RagA family TonB-linked outer membrane protein [Sphingobacterium cellulitidis]